MPAEEEALAIQTIEMFEVVTQSNPLDSESLEILKEAYFKLNRQKEAVATAKRIADAYVQTGKLSSAILEYEASFSRLPRTRKSATHWLPSRTGPSRSRTRLPSRHPNPPRNWSPSPFQASNQGPTPEWFRP